MAFLGLEGSLCEVLELGEMGVHQRIKQTTELAPVPQGQVVCTRNEKVVLKPGLTSLDTVLYQTLASGRNNQ